METRTSSQAHPKHQLRIDAIYVLLLLLLGAAVYFSTIRPGHDWGGDFSMYIIEARNLALGRPYTQSGYLVDPELPPLHAPPSYPPLFPLLLVPLYRQFGLNYYALKVFVQLILLLSWVPYYVLARQRGLSPLASFFTTGAFGLSALMLLLKESVLPEGLYLLLAGSALVAITWIYQHHRDETHAVRAAVIVAGLLLLAYASRAAGLTLAMGFGAYEIWRARRVRRFALMTLGGLAAAMMLYSFFIYDSRGYGREFSFAPAIYLQNVIYYSRAPAALWAGAPPLLRYPLPAAVFPLTALAWLRSVIRRPTVTEFYFLASIGVVLLYSSGRTTRYLLPAFPIALIYVVEAAAWLAERYLPRYQQWAMASLFGVLTLGVVLNVRAMETGLTTDGPESPSFLHTCAFIRNNTPPDSVFVFWNPRVLALYTNRTAAWFLRTTDDARFDRYLARIHASYVVSYRGSEDNEIWLRPHIQREPARFRALYQNTDFQVYQVVR